MKKIGVLVAAIMFTCTIAVNANVGGDKKEKKAKTELKAHVCTDACKNGKHMYAHGEKGHKCGKECKKDDKKS